VATTDAWATILDNEAGMGLIRASRRLIDPAT
jgi:hypothetical protein